MSAQQVRGTQSAVAQMGWVFSRPSLTALEVAWRWLIGAPLLLVCWTQAQKILIALPLEATGVDKVSLQDPWVSSVRLADAWDMYRPLVVHVVAWLGPVAALAWMIVSGIGRNLVLKRLEPGVVFRPLAIIGLQATWLAA